MRQAKAVTEVQVVYSQGDGFKGVTRRYFRLFDAEIGVVAPLANHLLDKLADDCARLNNPKPKTYMWLGAEGEAA